MKNWSERGGCFCHARWLFLVLGLIVLGCIGGFESVTVIESDRCHKAIRPFPELIIAFATQ